MPIEEGTLDPLLRRLETHGLLRSEWKIEDGPVFLSTISDQLTKSILSLVIAITLLDSAGQLYRGVRPAPDRRMRA